MKKVTKPLYDRHVTGLLLALMKTTLMACGGAVLGLKFPYLCAAHIKSSPTYVLLTWVAKSPFRYRISMTLFFSSKLYQIYFPKEIEKKLSILVKIWAKIGD